MIVFTAANFTIKFNCQTQFLRWCNNQLIKAQVNENITFRMKGGSGEWHSNENKWKREFQDHLLKNLYPKIGGPTTTFN